MFPVVFLIGMFVTDSTVETLLLSQRSNEELVVSYICMFKGLPMIIYLYFTICVSKIIFFLNHKVAYFIINERESSESIDTFMQMFGKTAEAA